MLLFPICLFMFVATAVIGARAYIDGGVRHALPAVAVAPALIALVVIVFGGDAALAGDGASVSMAGFVDLLAPYAEAIASGAILAFLTWLTAALRTYLGLNMDARHREALHSAALTGVRQAISSLHVRAGAKPVEVRSALVAKAVEWMETSVPGAIGHFGLTPSRLQILAESKLAELLMPTTAAAATATPASSRDAVDALKSAVLGMKIPVDDASPPPTKPPD